MPHQPLNDKKFTKLVARTNFKHFIKYKIDLVQIIVEGLNPKKHYNTRINCLIRPLKFHVYDDVAYTPNINFILQI